MKPDERSTTIPDPRAVLVGVLDPRDRGAAEPPLAELRRLAETAGAVVVGEITQRRNRPDRRFFVGKGKAAEVAALAEAQDADLVMFDNDLTPGQERNLAKVIGRQVIDRSRLILDIFATHARTRQARLQVELAQLEYVRSRLTRMWSHLDRERLEGAIGSRGPGEKQLEVDRRLISKRIQALRKALEVVERQTETRAAARTGFFRVALVGYTNAGKSTLLERLTGSAALIEDQLFATLDTQTRGWELPGNQRVFLSDTVGFIRDLPHHLVASFHSTLAEVVNANLLLHVADISNPDTGRQMAVVDRVLKEIGAGANPRLVVFNKIDDVADPLLAADLQARHPGAITVSALTGLGVDGIEERVSEIAQATQVDLDIRVPAGDGRLLAFIAGHTRVLEQHYEDSTVHLRLRASPRDASRIRRHLGIAD